MWSHKKKILWSQGVAYILPSSNKQTASPTIQAFLSYILPEIRSMLEAFKHEVADLLCERVMNNLASLQGSSLGYPVVKNVLPIVSKHVTIDETLVDIGLTETNLERGDKKIFPLGERASIEDIDLTVSAEKLKNLKNKK